MFIKEEINQILREYEKLNESLLTSDFTFGFELEGVLDYSSKLYSEMIDNAEADYDSNIDYSENGEKILEEFRKYLDELFTDDGAIKTVPSTESNMTVDGSVKRNNELNARENELDSEENDYDDYGDSYDEYYNDYTDEDMDLPFEYSSPAFYCTPKTFNHIIKCLYSILKRGVYTNTSCGFHHHFKFNGMTEADMAWIYAKLATEDDFYDEFKYFSTENDSYRFFDEKDYNNSQSGYATVNDLEGLRQSIFEQDYEQITRYINTEKYRVFRIHPQGTLEWRGPRGFLNESNFQSIKDFYILVIKLINSIKKFKDSNELNIGDGKTISRKEFLDKLKEAKQKVYIRQQGNPTEYISSQEDTSFKSPHKTDVMGSDTIRKLFVRFNKHPEQVAKLVMQQPQFLVKVIKNSGLNILAVLIKSVSDYINKTSDKEIGPKLIKLLVDNDISLPNINILLTKELIPYITDDDLLKMADNSNFLYRNVYQVLSPLIFSDYPISVSLLERMIYLKIKKNKTHSFHLSDIVMLLDIAKLEKYVIPLQFYIIKLLANNPNIFINLDKSNPDYISMFADRVKKLGSKKIELWDNLCRKIVGSDEVFIYGIINLRASDIMNYLTYYPASRLDVDKLPSSVIEELKEKDIYL